jgi:hypothetical protein
MICLACGHWNRCAGCDDCEQCGGDLSHHFSPPTSKKSAPGVTRTRGAEIRNLKERKI